MAKKGKVVDIRAAAAKLWVDQYGNVHVNDTNLGKLIGKGFGLGGKKGKSNWSGRAKLVIYIEELSEELETEGVPTYPVEILERYLKDEGLMPRWESLEYDTPDQRAFYYEGKHYYVTEDDEIIIDETTIDPEREDGETGQEDDGQ
jgi:hypothetical protein